ncbi:MAG: cytochrome C [Candidatus Omnitrophota bacterium]
METIKNIINYIAAPKIMFTVILLCFFFVFPPTNFFERINRRLKLYLIWTKKGGIILFATLFSFFIFGLMDENFRLIVLKPDNVPIVGLLFLVVFFLWLSMYQATINDQRLSEGKKPTEYHDPNDKVLVWPDLVYIELIALIVCSALIIAWAILLPAPLEEPANPTVSPNPSKAPWYFLGLQEMLVYFDPWIAGVLFPTIILLGLMAIPYIDTNREGAGYYSFSRRKMAVSIFLFFWLALWIFLISTGTFLRGPNWNFFGPFEKWDIAKLTPLNNINLSEFVYMIVLQRRLPENILLREAWGFLALGGYFLVLPILLAKTLLKDVYKRLGSFRYSIFVIFLLIALLLPLKMYLRWIFNLKYIIAIPEFFFNI